MATRSSTTTPAAKKARTTRAAGDAAPAKTTRAPRSAPAGTVAKPARVTKNAGTEADISAPQSATPRVNERVRARTRGKLLQAARVVMGRKGIASTAINDITEEAQVAFGSFYNYFSSKEEVARAVFVEDMLALADLLDKNRLVDADIALVIGLNLRLTLRHALADPIWGWFLVHAASSVGDLVETMGGRLARDIRMGVDAGRFDCGDILTTMDCIIGGALRILRQVLEGRRPHDAIDRFIEFALRGLGVDGTEVPRIVKSLQQFEDV